LPTSKDIAVKKALIVKREMQLLDSQRNAKLDSAAVQVSDTANVKAIADGEANVAQLKAQQKDVQFAQKQSARQAAVQAAGSQYQQVANENVAQTQLKYKYYLIVGSYRQATSVEKRLQQFRNMEASPVTIPLKNGLTMVSAVGFNSLSDAEAAISDVADLAPDAWVYSRASGLHK